MRSLFDELREDGELAINRWISDQIAEDLHFDCKCKADATKFELDREDRRNLGKALSAFANSDGGLLLWGVDAREEKGIDCLISKRPIHNLSAFRSRLEHAITDVISPPIPGLTILEITCIDDKTSGYLAILAPASEHRPHMSRANSNAGIYFRNGHQSLLMEVFQIRDQMLRTTAPKLELNWSIRVMNDELSFHKHITDAVPVSLDLILENTSMVSARFPYLFIRFNSSRYLTMGPKYEDFAKSCLSLVSFSTFLMEKIVSNFASLSVDWQFTGGSDCCIHPGTSMRVAGVTLTAPATQTFAMHNEVVKEKCLYPQYDLLPDIFAEVSFGCLDTPREKQLLEINGINMQSKILTTGQHGAIILKSGLTARCV